MPEPAFLSEWIEARDFIEITGRTCVSLLSGSLQLYLRTWDQMLSLKCSDEFGSQFRNGGFVGGYRACFARKLRLPWNDCPADLELIEQVVLSVRNRDQHPDSITTLRVSHSPQRLDPVPQAVLR